jgi:hypothetical protein
VQITGPASLVHCRVVPGVHRIGAALVVPPNKAIKDANISDMHSVKAAVEPRMVFIASSVWPVAASRSPWSGIALSRFPQAQKARVEIIASAEALAEGPAADRDSAWRGR